MDEKTKKPRRVRVDSPAGVAAAVIAGNMTITLPPGIILSSKERIIFDELCDEFSKSELSDHKVRLTASLAKELATIEEQHDLLAQEGSVLTNSHGNAVLNPRVKIVQNSISTMLAMRRSLGIHARELAGGNARRIGIMREHNIANETMLDDMDDEGLLNRPTVVPPNPRKDN